MLRQEGRAFARPRRRHGVVLAASIMTAWREAHALLRRRADGAADLVRAGTRVEIPPLPFVPSAVRSIVATGIGSSAAHAALLAHLLAEMGLPARTAAPGSFVAAPRDRASDVLVVFSQGLSPNARLALARPQTWAAVVLVTAVAPTDAETPAEKRAAIAAVARAGGIGVALPGGVEYGTLLRVGGPLAGYAVAYRLAAAIARAAGQSCAALELDPDAVCAHMAAARHGAPSADPFEGRVAFLASGGYGEVAGNLSLKVQEGLLCARPPIWDLLEFAHGPFQEMARCDATLLMLRRRGAPLEAELLERLRAMLAPARHRLIVLSADLPGAQALFEHEASLNELVLRAIARRQIDQSHRPNRADERPLYEVAEPAEPPPTPAPPNRPTANAAALTWPELEALVAAGCRTAVLPLGATEQHGPHLPLAADTIVADALAERFCARVAGTVRFPALPFGCSAEHGAFPGTVSLAAATLRAVLRDAVASLAGHGFDAVFIFSAHGGNCAALGEALPALRAAAPTAQVIAVTDLAAVTAMWQRAAAAAGIAPNAAGHHAGELETSLLLALAPGAVRRDRLAPGLLAAGDDAQAVFYPDLRRHAASGVVGDPRPAAAARAHRYLDAWVDLLVAHYRREKKPKNTTGTQNA